MTRVHVLTRELGDSSLGGFGGFGWATRRCATLLAGQPDTSCTIVTTRVPDRRAPAVDGIPLQVVPDGRWRRELWMRTRAPDVVLTVDYHTSFFRPLRVWADTGSKAIVWARDPRGTAETDFISTLRVPGDDHEPQGVTRGDSTSMGVLADVLRRRGHEVTYAVPTPFLAHRVRTSYGLAAATVEHLPNPIEPVAGAVTKSPTPVVAFLGRLDPIKRPWLFFDLARMLPDVRFVCMGSARLVGAGTWHPTDVPSNLELVGQAEEGRKRAELSRAWLLVNTSIHEGLPVSFCEALAHEVPIVSTTDTDHVPSRFGAHVGRAEGDGRSVLPDLRAAVAGLLADDERRLALGAAGRAWVESTHSPAAFLETFGRLISGPGRKANR